MKPTIIIIGILLLVTLNAKAQDYVPFPTGNVNWNVFYSGGSEDGPPDKTLIRYAIHGDTTIKEIQYYKLCIEEGDTLNPTIRGIGGLRENDKKIYYIGETITIGDYEVEYLLYDFTKQIGDTIKHDPEGLCFSVILDIDSVLIFDSYRKRYKVDLHGSHHSPDYIIEGIGSVLNSLLGHISPIPTRYYTYWEHVCFRENGIVKYLNPAFDECFPSDLLYGIKPPAYESTIQLYPNPFKNEIVIVNLHNCRNLVFKLIDINGKTVITTSIKGDKVAVPVNISAGIYNAVIVDGSGKILITQKMVKE
ncbi:MAG TPA: T9SS type A sorting domain-containing protein [Tenuifilaceae bacterium]|nr:T9SS type A sorting domain-containing protein [Tenuifilaceae bacterium]